MREQLHCTTAKYGSETFEDLCGPLNTKTMGFFYGPLLEAYLFDRFGIDRPTALLLGYELLTVLSETGCEKDKRKVRPFVSSTTYSFNKK